jgi:hypothetical protein
MTRLDPASHRLLVIFGVLFGVYGFAALVLLTLEAIFE